jgi:FkbM family methyltransferase
MIKRIINKLKAVKFRLTKIDPITGIKIKKSKCLTLGNVNAAWTIPFGILNKNSICYLVGAGEEISFDIEVAEKFRCKVLTIDPTPRAIEHYNKRLLDTIKPKNLDTVMEFLPFGIWNDDTKVKFYAPQNPNHVSHSVVNLQKTDTYFEAEVKKLTTVMKMQDDTKIDLLKIDIEGAEYEVIKSFIAERIFPKVICIEYDETFNAQDEHYKKRISESVKLIMDQGYALFHIDYPGNFTFLRSDEDEK